MNAAGLRKHNEKSHFFLTDQQSLSRQYIVGDEYVIM